MATYTVDFSGKTAEHVEYIRDYLRDTVAPNVNPRAITATAGVVWFGPTVRDQLAALSPESDGHIDRDGAMWWNGASYPVEPVIQPQAA